MQFFISSGGKSLYWQTTRAIPSAPWKTNLISRSFSVRAAAPTSPLLAKKYCPWLKRLCNRLKISMRSASRSFLRKPYLAYLFLSHRCHFCDYRAFQDTSEYFPEAFIAVPETQAENVISDLTGSGHSVGLIPPAFSSTPMCNLKQKTTILFASRSMRTRCMCTSTKTTPCQVYSIPLERLLNETVVIFRLFTLPETNTFYQDFRKLNHCYTVDSYELLKRASL